MIQYLLNTTAIWFASLLLFDVFLKRESYHAYNRMYLLFTFLCGLLLPLLTLQTDTFVYHTVYNVPVHSVQEVRQTIVSNITPTQRHLTLQTVLGYGYIAGVLIAMGLLAIDIIKVARWYHSGKRYSYGNNVIVETGRQHTPFSLFHIVFLNSSAQYEEDELQIILNHENRHYSLWHIADILLMQTAKIVFWFHPLVYLYNNRLLMTHEYQADALYSHTPKVYGNFLLSQSMLAHAPAITNSFNRSPIKNRIIMLTNRSAKKSYAKLLVVLPLFAASLLCFTQTGYSYKKGETNTILFKGNEFEFSGPGGSPGVANGHPAIKKITVKPNNDGTSTEAPVTMKMPTSVFVTAVPVKMNGKKIYDYSDTKANPVFQGKDNTLINYLFNGMRTNMAELPDGQYSIEANYIVIDENGKIVYYENRGIMNANAEPLDKKLKTALDKHLSTLLDSAPLFSAAILNNKPVVFVFTMAATIGTRVIVKNHQATLVEPQAHQ